MGAAKIATIGHGISLSGQGKNPGYPAYIYGVKEYAPIIDLLRSLATQSAARSHAPYSGRNTGVVILLEDGGVVHGCRVENASFQLTIPALLNAWTTLHAIGRLDVAAIVGDQPFSSGDRSWLEEMPEFSWAFPEPDVAMTGDDLPEPSETLAPLLEDWGANPVAGAEAARDAAELAHTPESDFPVGCVVRTKQGHHVPGVNVEHPDWAHILCAERNALSTLVAYGYGPATEIHVSCIKEPGGTPCGACRQVMLELAPEATVWMDRIDEPPYSLTVRDLLPGGFKGSHLRKKR
jgi:cytidine deaminase